MGLGTVHDLKPSKGVFKCTQCGFISEEAAAATRIQSRYRGYQTRKSRDGKIADKNNENRGGGGGGGDFFMTQADDEEEEEMQGSTNNNLYDVNDNNRWGVVAHASSMLM